MLLKTSSSAILIVLVFVRPSLGQAHVHAHGNERTSDHGPIAYVESEVIDLGEVQQHTRVPGSFFLENHGDEDLVIKSMGANCGCTVLELDEADKVIPPQQKQKIDVFFSTDDQFGRQRKKVTIVTNDPDHPVTELALAANVLGCFRVEPSRRVTLNAVHPGDRLPSIELFPNEEGATLENLEIELQGGVLEYAMESVVNDEGVSGIGVSFNVADEIELGPVDTIMILRGTVNGETLALPALVRGTVVGPIEVRPSRIESTHPTPRGRVFAPVTLRPTDGANFDVRAIDAGPYLESSHQPGKEPGDIDIILKLAEKAPDGPLAIDVAVQTSKPTMPIVHIPVYVDVLPRCRVSPGQVVLIKNKPDDVRRVRLQSDIVSTLEITSASCDNPGIAVRVVEPVRERTKVRFIEVQLNGDADAPGEVSATLSVKTNVPGAEQLTIPIECRPGE